MTAPTVKLISRDLSVLKALKRIGRPSAAYVVRNWVDLKLPLTTAQVLESLKSLERAGLVKRFPSNSQVMLCWLPVDEEVK